MEKKYEIDRDNFMSKGDNGKIFDIGDGKLAKVPYNGFNDQLFAIEMGIRYPEIEGIFAVKEKKSGDYYPAIVMKNLKEGVTLDNLEGDVLKEALRQKDLEKEKARELGIIIPDHHRRNSMWYNNQLYFIDAEKNVVMNEFC